MPVLREPTDRVCSDEWAERPAGAGATHRSRGAVRELWASDRGAFEEAAERVMVVSAELNRRLG